jgi:hypothetical protein
VTSDLLDVIVTFVDNAPELRGVVTTSDGRASEAVVVIFPTDAATWTNGATRRLSSKRPAAGGTFSFTGLIPGEYFVAAIPEASMRAWEPSFLQALSRIATKVQVKVGDKAVQNVTVGAIK